MSAPLLGGTAILLTALAGCAGGTTQGYAHHPYYNGATGIYAATDRDMKVVVVGNPTGLPQEQFDRAVTAAMQGKNGQYGTRFTTTPGETWRADYHVVVAFGAPISASGNTYCRYGTFPEPDLRTRPIRVVAAFCDADKMLSEVLASMPDVRGPADLEALMGDTVLALMPPLAPHERQGPGGNDRKADRGGPGPGKVVARR